MKAEHWVIFRLEAGEFALPLERVVEVLRMVAMRAVPEAPAWLAGVINLRGRALPVIDLRRRLGLPPRAPRLDTRIIVVELDPHWVGLLADEVVEVISEAAVGIDLPEALRDQPGRSYTAIQSGGRLISVFDLDRLSGEAGALAQAET